MDTVEQLFGEYKVHKCLNHTEIMVDEELTNLCHELICKQYQEPLIVIHHQQYSRHGWSEMYRVLSVDWNNQITLAHPMSEKCPPGTRVQLVMTG